MRQITRYLPPVIIIAVGLLGFFLLGMMRAAPPQDALEVQPPLVEVVDVQPYDRPLTLVADGEVVPFRESTVAAESPGRIATKSESCDAGRNVMLGDVLVQVDPRDYELDVRRLHELVEQARVGLDEVEIEADHISALMDLAEQELALQSNEVGRLQTLRTASIASRSALESAQKSELQLRNSLQRQRNAQQLLSTRRQRAQRELARLESELQRAQLALERTAVRAPVTGIVTEDLVEENEFVAKGTPVATVLDLSRLDIAFQLRLDELSWIWPVTSERTASENFFQLPPIPVEVVLPVGDSEYIWDGKLARYDGARVDPATRTVPCLAEITDGINSPRRVARGADGAVRPVGAPTLMQGMYVTLRIHVEDHADLVEVPYAALRVRNGGYEVCLYESGRIRFQRVKLAYRVADRALLFASDGPQAGQRVLRVAPPNAIDQMRVRVVTDVPSDATPPAASPSESLVP